MGEYCWYVRRGVNLVARRDLGKGDALTLDYGHKPLRDMMRGYSFVPTDSAFEVVPTCGMLSCPVCSNQHELHPQCLLPHLKVLSSALAAHKGLAFAACTTMLVRQAAWHLKSCLAQPVLVLTELDAGV